MKEKECIKLKELKKCKHLLSKIESDCKRCLDIGYQKDNTIKYEQIRDKYKALIDTKEDGKEEERLCHICGKNSEDDHHTIDHILSEKKNESFATCLINFKYVCNSCNSGKLEKQMEKAGDFLKIKKYHIRYDNDVYIDIIKKDAPIIYKKGEEILGIYHASKRIKNIRTMYEKFESKTLEELKQEVGTKKFWHKNTYLRRIEELGEK